MNTRHSVWLVSLVVALLLFAGCDDSKNPLSDPQDSKPDARLVGVWRLRGDGGEVTYYHIGPLGNILPSSLMRVVSVTHSKNGELQPPGQLLLFPTTLGAGSYLNIAEAKEEQIKLLEGKEPQINLLEKKAWNPDVLSGFLLQKYKVEGDGLLVWPMDGDAKKAAIEGGKVKGVVEKQDSGNRVRFTDTTENLARFVAGVGDNLFSKEVLRLERVK